VAEIIFDTVQRGIHRYHKIESFPVTVGRAYDNDVILQDVTISPHHLVIEKEDDKLFIRNLSTENGTKIGRKKLDVERVEVDVPISFQLSSIKARLLSSDMPVEKTYIKDCNGFFCIFNSSIWAVCLFLITIGLLFFEQYLNTHVPREASYYLQTVFPAVCVVLGMAVVISLITRFTIHRWEVIPAISIASLVFLLPHVFEYIGKTISYLFTNDSLQAYLTYLIDFIVIPVLIAFFIVKVINKKWIPAAGLAALIYSPILALQVIDLLDNISFNSGFSEFPSYSQTLLPGDNRLNATISEQDRS